MAIIRYRLIGEFFRYCLVGGASFIADFVTLVACQEMLLNRYQFGVYVAAVLGFIVGLTVNYTLSLWFVFTQVKDRGKGRTMGAFALFGAISAFGLIWTELGMWIGVGLLEWNYMITKILVAGLVLGWNYIGKKILIFN